MLARIKRGYYFSSAEPQRGGGLQINSKELITTRPVVLECTHATRPAYSHERYAEGAAVLHGSCVLQQPRLWKGRVGEAAVAARTQERCVSCVEENNPTAYFGGATSTPVYVYCHPRAQAEHLQQYWALTM